MTTGHAALQAPAQLALEEELKAHIVAGLSLETTAAEIDSEAPLFGTGLGLDSIDALEISLLVSKAYGVQLRSDDAQNHRIFASLRMLAAHVAAHRTR